MKSQVGGQIFSVKISQIGNWYEIERIYHEKQKTPFHTINKSFRALYSSEYTIYIYIRIYICRGNQQIIA